MSERTGQQEPVQRAVTGRPTGLGQIFGAGFDAP
jgi:hypothetical protein